MSEDTNNPQGQPVNEEGLRLAQIRVPFPDSFVYSNVSALSLSMLDLRIGFGEAMPDATVQPRVGIVMPPEHAAALTLNMFQQLITYEHNFGPIRHPQWREFQHRVTEDMLKDQQEKSAQPGSE